MSLSKFLTLKNVVIAVVLLIAIALSSFLLTRPKQNKDIASGNTTANNILASQKPTITNRAALSDEQKLAALYAKGDVIDMQTFECKPRNDHEFYRTDHTLVVDPSDPDTMYVNVEYKGLFKSTDGGKTWNQKTKGIKVYAREDDKSKGCYSEYPVLRIDPTNPKRLVLGASGPGGGFLDTTTPNSQVGGVYQTFDGGEHWELMINNTMNVYVSDIAIDKNHPETVYYGTSSNPASYSEADQTKIFVKEGLVYKTADSGKTWKELPTGIGSHTGATSVMINPKDSNELVVTTFSANRLSADGTGTGLSTGKDTSVGQMGVLHSIDGGNTWTKLGDVSAPIINGQFSENNFKHMYLNPSGTSKPVSYVTTNGMDFKESRAMTVVSYDPFDKEGNHMVGFTINVVGSGSQNLNMWESRDAGMNWIKLGTLPKDIKDPVNTNLRPSQIIWHPKDPKTFFMSGGGGKVWKTSDMGKTWDTLLSYEDLP